MQISTKAWRQYIRQMSQISQRAADLMTQWIQKNGFKDDKALLDYAFALTSHYGQAIGALSCRMYEATAEAQGVIVPTAEMASLPEYGEVTKAVHGTMKQSQKKVPATMARLVKQVGADTTLKNALRDGAQFAWIPHGDTCAFCLTLASRGWQYMSKNALKNGHAEHIHANCDCEYAVRFDGKSTVEGYDPEKYLEMYKNAEGNTPEEKVNFLRRKHYAEKKLLEREEKTGTIKLTESEKRVLLDYKSFTSYTINDALRRMTSIEDLTPEQKKFVLDLDAVLKKTPKYEGTLIRTIDFSDYLDAPDRELAFVSEYVPDETITIYQYWSTSKKEGYNDDAKIKIYIENSRNGRGISSIGLDENEVLYERKTTFLVKNKINQDGKWYIMLWEV